MKLVLARFQALDHYVSSEFAAVLRELVEVFGWRLAEFSVLRGSLPEALLDAVGEVPEVLLFWEGYDFIVRHAHAIRSLGCRTAVFADDLHWLSDSEHYAKLAAFLLCDLVLATTADRLPAYFPEVHQLARVVWVPHAASPEFLLPWNSGAQNALLLSGAIQREYPMRQALKALCDEGRYPIVHLPHPGYHCGYDHGSDPRVGAGYARTLHRYRAAFTDGGQQRYIVAKCFEIPGTGALLLADRDLAPSLARLGFLDGEHYTSTSIEDFEDRIQDVLNPSRHEEFDVMRKNAHVLIRDRHTTSHRARLIDESCRA